jgi:hypothetical protein
MGQVLQSKRRRFCHPGRSGELALVFVALSLSMLSCGCAGTVASKNPIGNPAPAAPASLAISAVANSSVTTTAATITWITNITATSQVDYGTTGSYGQSTALNSAMVTNHAVMLSNLAPSTLYHYRADSQDAGGNAAQSPDFTFITAPPAKNAPPTVSITSPAQGTTVSGTTTVSATASSSVGIASVQFQLDGANLGTAAVSAPYTATWDTATASNGSHSLAALARDTAGNTATSTTVKVTVLNNSGTVVHVMPSQDWCGMINSVAPGTTVVMTAGTYTSACSVTSSGTANAPIVVRAASSAASDKANLTYQGNSSNVLDVYGAYLQLQWLTFSGMQSGVDAIRLHSGAHDFAAIQNTFQNLGGTAVVYNDSGTADKINVIGNTVRNSTYTPFYLGCQDGTCHATNALVDSNLVDTVMPTDGSVGYAVEVKLNSYGVVQNNTFYNTHGPCITVYGSNEGDPATIVQGNYVQGSMTDAGINISGGPAIVWNNVAVRNAHGGIWAQDYGGRGLQRNVWITFNTVVGNGNAGIITENWAAGNGDVLAYNAIAPVSGTPALHPASPGGMLVGNVTCSPATTCFDQPTTAPYDLWPVAGGPLIGAGSSGTESWRPPDDFMGAPRGNAADVGAFQRTNPGNGPMVGGGAPRPPRS